MLTLGLYVLKHSSTPASGILEIVTNEVLNLDDNCLAGSASI
jgi:hypothetical protein